MNLTRVCLKIVDNTVLSTISPSEIAQYEIIEYLNNKSLNGLPIAKRVRKFRGVLQSKYGALIECTEHDFEKYAKNAERIRLDCESEAGHNLSRLLDEPGRSVESRFI